MKELQMVKVKEENIRWWEKEPLLIYEQNMATLPGISSGNDWQVHADPEREVNHIKASNALQTHGLSFIDLYRTTRRYGLENCKPLRKHCTRNCPA
jgi:hypothetical protein